MSSVCSVCRTLVSEKAANGARWNDPAVLEQLRGILPDSNWGDFAGACPACVQRLLLITLVRKGESALHESVQAVWPLDAEAAFGALPTPLRLHADPRYTGKGVTMAFLDSGFYPHPDLVEPLNRIKAWVDVSGRRTRARFFEPDEKPLWPGWDDRDVYQWHGLMTSCAAAGNGWMSQGLYRGLASDAELVLIQVGGRHTHVGNTAILKALKWLIKHAESLGVRVVNISVGGDPIDYRENVLDEAVGLLVKQGITVVAAAGNEGQRRLVPPASAPAAITVGGIDDKNLFDRSEIELWHSNYGESVNGSQKPELVAPSIWVVAPMLPETPTALEAQVLFQRRESGDTSPEIAEKMAREKLVTPHYQHVDGTSFAAPLTSSVIASALQANPALSPARVRALLRAAARPVEGAPIERQGAGVLDAGQAVALAVWDRHEKLIDYRLPPLIGTQEILYFFHDVNASSVEVFGSWNDWQEPALQAQHVEDGVWKAAQELLPPGRYEYKFRLDGSRWMDDPANPRKSIDPNGIFNSVLIVP